MKFVKSEGTAELEKALVETLNTALAKGKNVLWLIPGGSNIKVAVSVMNKLDVLNLHHMTAVLTDERFGEPGHQDSNYFQLHQAGFEERGVHFDDVLVSGVSFEDCVVAADALMKKAFEEADVLVGFFGMGSDGHVAGILPNSPATIKDAKWVIGYDGGQYKRMTLTPYALSHIQTGYVGAFGPEKLTALETLQHTALPVAEQPAQLLRHIPDVTVFNDLIGDTK